MKHGTGIFLLILLMGSFFMPEGKVENSLQNKRPKPAPKEVSDLLQKNGCYSCHHVFYRIVGPSFLLISKKKYTAKKIAELLVKPQPENWPGYPAMAPITTVPYEEVVKISNWINSIE